MLPEYRVYGLRYGTHRGRRVRENFLKNEKNIHGSERMDLDFYIWAIISEERALVVDTGFNRLEAFRRGRDLLHDPRDLLENAGVTAELVTDVIITHMHYDHAGNMDLFPNARFHLQEEEMQFCTGRLMGNEIIRNPFNVENIKTAVDLLFQERIVFHKGSESLYEGVSLLHLGGHTPGLQAVLVNTQRGQIILASDALHYWDNLNKNNPFPIFNSLSDMMEGYKKMTSCSLSISHIIPGHDPKVRDCFPALEGFSDIVQLHLDPKK